MIIQYSNSPNSLKDACPKIYLRIVDHSMHSTYYEYTRFFPRAFRHARMRTAVRTTDERVASSRDKLKEGKRKEEGEREIMALSHADLLNSALWLTSSVYYGAYVRLDPAFAYYYLAEWRDRTVSRLKERKRSNARKRGHVISRVSGHKLFREYRDGEKNCRLTCI